MSTEGAAVMSATVATVATVKDTFQLRVRNATKGRYQQVMRRSLQSIALWEAHRSLESRYAQLRPFQRKYALVATAVELLKTLDFLDYYQRQEVMYRTIASREPISAELAWKRMKVLARDIGATIVPRARDLLARDEGLGRTHDEMCDALLQAMYDESREGNTCEPYPANWEFKHNNVFTVYRIYYRGVGLDPDVFPATPPKVVEVARGAAAPGAPLGAPPASAPARPSVVAEIKELGQDKRRAMLQEVKEHTEILNSFIGLIPDEEIAVRKRALYELLPEVPFSIGGAGKKKRKRRTKAAMASVPAALPAAPRPVALAALPAIPALPAMDESAASAAAEPPAAADEEDWEKALKDEAAQSVAAEC